MVPERTLLERGFTRLSFLLTLLVAWVLVFSIIGCEKGGVEGPGKLRGEKATSTGQNEILAGLQGAFIHVAEEAIPSVVNISTTPKIKDSGKTKKKPFYHNFLEELFPGFPQGPETSLGSGLIISEEGYIVSNEHVIKDAGEITVRFYDKSEYRAKVVGVDPKTDIAVLKIPVGKHIHFAKLGDSSGLKVGQWAVAVGNPFGLSSTVTVGVISAIGRSDIGVEAYEDFIQTDASINPGNSGGPLLDISGDVIGINTAIISAGQGIGFAIPINLVKNITDQIIRTGTVRRGWLGVGIQNLTHSLAKSFGIPGQKGILVNNIIKESPAGKAGLKRRDIILSFNGEPVDSVKKFQKIVATYEVGKKAKLGVMRGKKRIRLDAVIGEMPLPTENFVFKETAPDRLGLAVANLSGSTMERLEIEGGVRVESVSPDSPGYEGGLREGDIIVDIGKVRIMNVEDYRRAVNPLEKGITSLLVLRRGRNVYLAISVGPAK